MLSKQGVSDGAYRILMVGRSDVLGDRAVFCELDDGTAYLSCGGHSFGGGESKGSDG